MYQRLFRSTEGGGDGVFPVESQGMTEPLEYFIYDEKQGD